MKDPRYLVVNYILTTKDGIHKDTSVGFAFSQGYSLTDNIQFAIDFVKVLHSVYSIESIVLKF